MKLTKLTVGLHIAISQNRCTSFYGGKPVFSANSVSFTPLYFVTSLSWQFLNRTKGNLKVKNSSSLIYHYAHFLLYGRGVEGGGGGWGRTRIALGLNREK